MPRGASREEHIALSRERLSRVLTSSATVAFVGAGLSVPLGYPRWPSMALDLIRKTLEAVRERSRNRQLGPDVGTLEDLERRLDEGEAVRAVELMFAIGLCQSLAGELRDRDSQAGDFLADYFRDTFKPRTDISEKLPNPHDALVELKIHRYVTTNYDAEIELALARAQDLLRDDLEIDGSAALRRSAGSGVASRHFTQHSDHVDRLALFAMSRIPEVEKTVFHCHGRYDEPESIVASEAGYQRWYLSRHEAAPGFRRTIELLLGSNPILFVGYGLQDEDLLQPLRLLAATDAARKEKGSVFALMPEAGDPRDAAYHESLRERYGVQVIPFPRPASDSAEAWGKAWVRELERLREDSFTWRESWISKPCIRRVEVGVEPPRAYQHYSLEEPERLELGRATVERKLAEIETRILDGARVVALVGSGGTGKSYHAMRLIERLKKRSGKLQGFFFWSSYYADDALTGIDRLLAYLEKPAEKTEGTRLERILACLRRAPYLVVLDGIERLLWETDQPEVGEPGSAHVRELLQMIASPESQSCVILTSRLLPRPYYEADRSDRVEIVPLERMTFDDVHQVPPFNAFTDEIHALCSLLGGHTYALVLAAGYLGSRPPRAADRALRELLHRLSGTPPDRRVSRMIREAVHALEVAESRLARKFLQHVAVFMSPVKDQALRHCYDLAVEAWRADGSSDPPRRRLQDLLSTLTARKLLFVIKDGGSGKAYTVHPTVRSFLFDVKYNKPSDPLPNFTLAGFTSGTAVLHPGTPETCDLIKALFERLVDVAEVALADGRREEARALCRSAFSVVRSRMEAITASRWIPYDQYSRFHYRLLDLARRISREDSWSYVDPKNLTKVERLGAPLYVDELAWLYNDLGLILCAEGDMPETYGIWEQGSEINYAIGLGQRPGQHVVQSLLHMSHTFIEIGRLGIAGYYLHQTEQANHSFGDSDYAARIVGYQGLIAHLQGDLHRAEDRYRKAIDRLEGAGRNPRAESIFRRHLADLLIEKGDLKEARRTVRDCRALAEAADYRDLVAYSRITQGHVYRKKKRLQDAMREYQGCLRRARDIGIRRLEADALSELSRLALDLGDAENARRQAMAALRLSNELGLGLRKTHGLVVLGLATVRTGPRELGITYLRQAFRMAEAQGYWLRGREIERALESLGEPPELSPVSRRGTM